MRGDGGSKAVAGDTHDGGNKATGGRNEEKRMGRGEGVKTK